MITSSYQMSGNLHIVLTDENGEIKQDQSVKNLVVNTGKNYIAQRIANNSTTVMNYMAVGTGNTSPGVANTTLITEVGRVTIGTANVSVSSNTTTYTATFPSGTGTGALVEAGIFNDPSTGLMLCRTLFPVVNKGALDTLTISWSVSAI